MLTELTSQPLFGMISSQEQEYLCHYASHEYSGQGEIVDLGCWLGSSTVELAKGLQSNPYPKASSRKVHAYDIFIWESWMDACVVGSPFEGKFKPGDSFFQECVDLTQPWQRQINFHPGDLNKLGWQGGAIEFLFIDAMKSWELANTIIHEFFSALIPEQSVIVHQDFTHYYTYWIYLTMYRLREYFEPVYDIPNSSSLVYKYIKPIPENLLKSSYTLESFSEDEINAAFNYASRLVSVEKRMVILSAKISAFIDSGIPHQNWRYATLDGLLNVYWELAGYTSHLKSQLEKAQTAKELEQNQLASVTEIPAVSSTSKTAKREKSALRQRVQHLESQLHTAQNRIEAMESSKFWKLRTSWFQLKNCLGCRSMNSLDICKDA